jgi:hypothetical protein
MEDRKSNRLGVGEKTVDSILSIATRKLFKIRSKRGKPFLPCFVPVRGIHNRYNCVCERGAGYGGGSRAKFRRQ